MIAHAAFNLRGDLSSVKELDSTWGDILEAPVTTISSRGHHRTVIPQDGDHITYWIIYVGF